MLIECGIFGETEFSQVKMLLWCLKTPLEGAGEIVKKPDEAMGLTGARIFLKSSFQREPVGTPDRDRKAGGSNLKVLKIKRRQVELTRVFENSIFLAPLRTASPSRKDDTARSGGIKEVKSFGKGFWNDL